MRAGYVPTTEIGPLIGKLLSRRGYTYEGLAEAVGCEETIIRRLAAGEYPSAKFDFVDRVFCELSAVQLWWGEFLDIYENVNFRQTCQSPVCSRTFPEQFRGGKVKQFCSRRCSNMAYNIQNGRGSGTTASNTCWRGHKLTQENTINQMGRRICRTCKNKRQRAWRKAKVA